MLVSSHIRYTYVVKIVNNQGFKAIFKKRQIVQPDPVVGYVPGRYKES